MHTASSHNTTQEKHLYHQALGQIATAKALSLAEQGVYSGKPVNGYLKSSGKAVHVVDEAKRERIAEVFRRTALEGLSVRQAQAVCREIGLTGANGKPISLNSLHLMLTNPFYAGFVRSEGKLVRGQHEPIISKTTFDTVQRNLGRRRC